MLLLAVPVTVACFCWCACDSGVRALNLLVFLSHSCGASELAGLLVWCFGWRACGTVLLVLLWCAFAGVAVTVVCYAMIK